MLELETNRGGMWIFVLSFLLANAAIVALLHRLLQASF